MQTFIHLCIWSTLINSSIIIKVYYQLAQKRAWYTDTRFITKICSSQQYISFHKATSLLNYLHHRIWLTSRSYGMHIRYLLCPDGSWDIWMDCFQLLCKRCYWSTLGLFQPHACESHCLWNHAKSSEATNKARLQLTMQASGVGHLNLN